MKDNINPIYLTSKIGTQNRTKNDGKFLKYKQAFNKDTHRLIFSIEGL